MSHRTPDEIREAFEQLEAGAPDILGELAQKYSALKLLQSEVNAAVGECNRALVEALEQQGLTRADAPGAKITLKTKRSLAIGEGEKPEEYQKNLEDARKWVEKWNPTTTDTGVTNLKRTLDAFFAENPDAARPSFLVENEYPQLSVSRT